MIFRLAFLITLLFFSPQAFASAQAETPEGPSIEEEILKSELELAKKPNIYFVINLKEMKISIKAKGMALKEIDIREIKFWGNSLPAAAYKMVNKSAFAEPRRDVITPQKEEEEAKKEDNTAAESKTDKFDIQALELGDMPSSYTLLFEEGFSIIIRPHREGFRSALYSAGGAIGWYLSRPLVTVWNTIKKRPYLAIKLSLSERDARALYWSFYDGANAVIYGP
ncbi:MAG: hypothetical protein HY809_06915 [Nitrospirae bacterium]|nr:hypothetical protein [Nitrospirota bacterium]